MEDTHSHHLGLFFDEDWNRHDSEQSFGHDIEASWLLMETALVLGDKDIVDNALVHTRNIAEAALQGRCVDGSVNRTDDKAGFWKCPYHNSRMCLEVYSILGEM